MGMRRRGADEEGGDGEQIAATRQERLKREKYTNTITNRNVTKGSCVTQDHRNVNRDRRNVNTHIRDQRQPKRDPGTGPL
jgi:hypothetical protein